MMSQQEKYAKIVESIHNLPDEMTRAFESALTNLVVDPQYDEMIPFLEKQIEVEKDEEVQYALFLMCGIFYRRAKEHGKQERLFHVYGKKFAGHPSYEHYRVLSYVDSGYHARWREMLTAAKENSMYMNHCGAQHLFAELVAMTFEEEHHDATEQEFTYWIDEAMKAVDMALMESPNYAKFYCTKGRLLSLLNRADEAQRYVRMAIEKEDSSKKDYTLRIGNYQYFLLKVQARADREQLKQQIEGYKEELGQAIVEVNEKAETIDQSLMRNLEYLGIFSGIISFTVGTINIASSLASVSFMGAAGLIVVLFGVLVGVFALFDLIIHGYKKENSKVYTIVFVIVMLALAGGFAICYFL